MCVCVCGGGHINIFSGSPQSSSYGPAHEGALNRGRIDGLTSHRCEVAEVVNEIQMGRGTTKTMSTWQTVKTKPMWSQQQTRTDDKTHTHTHNNLLIRPKSWHFQPFMQTWNIRYKVVVLHWFLIRLRCFSMFFFLCKHRCVWLLHSRLLQHRVHETAF